MACKSGKPGLKLRGDSPKVRGNSCADLRLVNCLENWALESTIP